MRRPLVGALVAVALFAASCARHGAVPGPEVVLWTPWPVEAVEPLARAYESEAVGVRVRVVAQPVALADSLLAAIAAGTPPDLCVLDDDEVPALLAHDALTDWSAGVADLRAGLRGWDLCRVGDALYGLPLRLRPQVLVVHPRTLARLRRTSPPATLADLRALATRRGARDPHVLGLPSADSGVAVRAVLPWAWGAGGVLPASPHDTLRFAATGNVEALAALSALGAGLLVASEDSIASEFVAGRLAMVVADPTFLARLERLAPRLEPVVAAVPGAPSVTVLGGDVLAGVAAGRRREDALRLARYLADPSRALALATALRSAPPAFVGADTTDWYRHRPAQVTILAQAGTARALPRAAGWADAERTLSRGFLDALAGRVAAAEVVARLDSVLARPWGTR